MSAPRSLQAVVIGAGQAGLAVSYYLRQAGIEHVVLERGRIGESWQSQRWDSFRLNTPNWSNNLPGAHWGGDPDAFDGVERLIEFFESYAARNDLPVIQNCSVKAVKSDDNGGYLVQTDGHDYRVANVFVASGSQNHPRTPALASDLGAEIGQLHTADYRNATQLAPGPVLVVGAGQSGCQIVEDLLEAGRKVFLSTSKVGRAVRRYRGRDLLAWWAKMGFFDVQVEDLEDLSMQFASQPQISGTHGGHTISLQQLAADGVVLLGRVRSIEGSRISFDDSLAENIEFADAVSNKLKAAVDAYIERAGLDVEAGVLEPAEAVALDPAVLDAPTELDLGAQGIRTVIWSTGFGGAFEWLELPVFGDDGRPAHTHGVASVPGIYFAGFSWLSKRKSGIIYGVDEDARHVVRHATARGT